MPLSDENCLPNPSHEDDRHTATHPLFTVDEYDHFGGLLGRSPAMRELFAMLERVAVSDVPVLIEGETGTGKELCAEAIHAASPRSGAPFIVCDLAGVPPTLIEGELFGHVRGAYTGADRDREGAFLRAASGTLFIDELGELDPSVQPRLLRFAERRHVKPVGGSTWREVDVRLVAATNRDLAAEVRAGRFRDDLFHRLAVVRVRLPPLRERKEDLPLLAAHFLARPAVGDVAAPPRAVLSSEALAALAAHDFPGNVRELRNLLDRALSMLPPEARAAEAEPPLITPELLGIDAAAQATPLHAPPDQTTGAAARQSYHEARALVIDRFERDYLHELLQRTAGNISRAAREAGMDRVYLHRLLKKHRMRVERSH